LADKFVVSTPHAHWTKTRQTIFKHLLVINTIMSDLSGTSFKYANITHLKTYWCPLFENLY